MRVSSKSSTSVIALFEDFIGKFEELLFPDELPGARKSKGFAIVFIFKEVKYVSLTNPISLSRLIIFNFVRSWLIEL